MRRTLVALVCAAGVSAADAQITTQRDDAAVKTFVAKLDAALAANDKGQVADLVCFPVEHWTIHDHGHLQEIALKDRDDVLTRYSTLVTPDMRKGAPKAELVRLETGDYSLIWHDDDLEYSFEIGQAKETYCLTEYLIGPY